MNKKTLQQQINSLRNELNVLYSPYGLNDYVLNKSIKLDKLIVQEQKDLLREYKSKNKSIKTF